MDWELFLGRFHPLMVHLPIGIFIMGYVLEILLQTGFRNLVESRKIVIVTYVLALLSGLVAAITGWLLSFSNNYDIASLSDHKQLGILTLIVILLVIIYQIKAPVKKNKLKITGSTIAIVLISVTGHLGGNLTHGSDYLLEYGPKMFKDNSEDPNSRLTEVNPDSLKIFHDIIKPLIQTKCLACHNSTENFGELNLENYDGLFKEAAHDIPVLAGNPEHSEFLKRVSLPWNHEKIMPPRKSGFSYTDVQILRYWIENGADSLARFDSETMNKELIGLIYRDYGLDYRPKPYYEKVKVDSLPESLIKRLAEAEFKVNYLGENNMLLDVEFKGDSVRKADIEVLNKISDHIVYLKMTGCTLTDQNVEALSVMQHLIRVDFSNNKLSDKVISFITAHEHMESVNLNENDISGKALQTLLTKPSIQRVYVSNTKVTDAEIEELQQNFHEKEIIREFKFKKVEASKSVFEQEKKK